MDAAVSLSPPKLTLIPLDGLPSAPLQVTPEKAYLAYMCHEIRTPVSAILGLINILTSTNATVDLRSQATAMLRDTSGLLSDLLDRVLDSAKMDEGMLVLEQTNFDIAKTAREAAIMVSAAAKAKHLALHIDIDAEVPLRLFGDSMRIRQIIVNLLSNAVKFTPQGSIFVSISAKLSRPGTRLLSISVTDTGIGMTEGECETIFDKYSQANPSISRRYGGTGLGLSISRSIARLMHGDVTVKSTPSVGSQFTATLELTDPTTLYVVG